MVETFGNEMSKEWQKLYGKIHAEIKKGKKCSVERADRTNYEELKKAFLPGRTLASVQKPCNRIANITEAILSNNRLLENNVEPSCSGVGLNNKAGFEDSIIERCYFSDDEGKASSTLVCDCPDGQGSFTPKTYARDNVVKCLDDKEVEAYYSDMPSKSLEQGLTSYLKAREEKDVSGMVLGCDAMVSSIHGSGAMAKFFIKGGLEALERLKKE